MLKKCENCGKFFGAETSDRVLCEECSIPEGLENVMGLTYEEKKYELARSIVYDNPEISPEELIKVMDDKGVEIKLKEIMSYVREGKMTLKSADGGVFCEACGKRILSGRLCPKCTHKFEESIANKSTPEKKETTEKKTSQRMYSQD